jgi:GntR family transcriptional regulator
MLLRPNPSSGVPIYLQLMEQVKHGIETGALRPGEQLPGIRPLAEELVINPNTVAKAYRDLEREGLVVARQGRGTFIASTLAPPSLRHHDELRAELERWLRSALEAGLDEESVRALISATLRESLARRVA